MSRRRSTVVFPLILVLAGLALIAGTVGLVINGRSALIPTATPETIQEEDLYPDVKRVSLKDAYAAYVNHTALFVDVRPKASFDQEHIPGAISIPLQEVPDRLSELPKEAWIISYCT